MTDARTMTRELGGRWRGRYGTAPCPVCQGERLRHQDALTLADGRVGLLAHCKKSGCSFRDIALAAGGTPDAFRAPDDAACARRLAAERAEAAKRSQAAAGLWREAGPIAGTAAETYLRHARAITCALPPTLRFHPACWHPAAQRLPALIALVEGANGAAVHRTYLAPCGRRKADVEPARAMLGATAGGAVRLGRAACPGGEAETRALTPARLAVAEGIETALSLRSGLLGEPADVWAALSASGMGALRLPAQPGQLVIAPDGDRPGRAAAHALAVRASGLGWQVLLAEPPPGADWSDVLMARQVPA